MLRIVLRNAVLVAVLILAASCGGRVKSSDPLASSGQRLATATTASHKPVCPPVGPGLGRCHSQIVTDSQSAVALSLTPTGFGPADLLSAYNVPTGGGAGQTIGIVDAFDNPFAEADLAAYRSQYGLPPCTSASGCFTKVNEQGLPEPLPRQDFNWAIEISLDIEMASAICPNCKILLVEASQQSVSDLGASVDTAVRLGATVVSNSYGFSEDPSYLANDSLYFNHPGVFITASSGDSGFSSGPLYPAASPYTVAVGGTSLVQDSTVPRGWSETVWNETGSGCSTVFPKPSWQTDTGCTMRMEADVSAVADPNTPVAVYSTFEGGWIGLGGTSVASPLVASLFAVVGKNALDASFVWQNPQDFYDVTSGSNGFCTVTYECTAGPGYDGPTGWGTPDGALVGSAIRLGTSAEACAGQSGPTTTVTVVGGSAGFGGDVSLSLVGVSPTPPAGGEITATFSPNPVPAPAATGATSTMQIVTTPTTPAGTYTLTVQGSSTGLTQSATTTVVVRDGSPGAMTLQSPASGAAGVPFTPTFTWTAATEDTSYTLDIFSSSDCSGTPLHAYAPTATTFAVPASDALPIYTSLSWQVTATNACTPPTISACSPFQTLSCAPSQDLVTNGGFEQGLTGWSSDATIPPPVVTTAQPHSGTYAAQLGEIGYFGVEPSGDSAISQVLTIPAGVSPTLSFWEWPETSNSLFFDQQYAVLTPIAPAGPAVTLLSEANNSQTYLQRQFSLGSYAGQTVRLTLGVHESGEFFYGTGMYVDDVSAVFTRCGPPDFALQITPTSTEEICAGSSLSFDVSVSSLNGPNFTSPVTLTASNLPPGAWATFAANPVAPGQSTTVTLQTTRPTVGQVYVFTVSGSAVVPPPSGSHSVSANVTIDANAPEAPQILSPSNGQVNVSMLPTLSWTAPFVPDAQPAAAAGGPLAFGAPQYHLQVALDAAFANVVIDTNLAATVFTPATSLPMATQYFWRVAATNACGGGPWSATSSFIVGACTEGWTTLGSMPAVNGGLQNASAVAVPEVGKIYVIGGTDGYGQSVNHTWAYDPSSDGWSLESDVPSPGVGATDGSAVALGGTIYVFGGNNYANAATLWRYTVATDTWSQGANLPVPNYASAVAAIDGKIYLAYGTGFGNQTWQYDPVTDAYTQKSNAPNLPSNVQLHGVALGGSLHAFGGGYQGTSHVVYTPATDTWTTGPNLPFGVTDPAVGVIGDKAYVVGGTPTAQTQIFDPATNAWTISAPLPGTTGGLNGTQGAALGPHMHVVGGYGANSIVNTHWQFHTCNAGALSSAAFLPLVVDGNGLVSGVTNERTSLLIDNSVSGVGLTATCFLYGASGAVLGRSSFNLTAGELYTATDVVRTLLGATTVQNIRGSVAIFGTDLFQVTASLVNNSTGDSAFESSQPIAGTLSGVLPAIEEGTDVTEAVFSNVSTNTAILELVAYPAAGGETPAAATLAFLPPNGTVDYANVVQQLNLPKGFLGELTFSSNLPVAAVARAVVPRRGYSGFEPVRSAADPASTVYVPYVEDTAAFSTTLLLNNPTLLPADVTVTLVDTEDASGASSGTATSRDVPLPVNAAMSIPNVVRWVLNSTATKPSGKHGFLVVTTPQALTAQAKIVDAVTGDPAVPQNESAIDNAFSPLLIRVEPISFAVTAPAASTPLAAEAAAATTSQTTLSRFALSNPGSIAATVELSAVNASGGAPTPPFSVTLPPNAQLFTEDLVGTMGLPPLFLGWLTVQSDMPVLVYNQRRSGDSGDSVPVCAQ
jgi:Kelch motif protein